MASELSLLEVSLTAVGLLAEQQQLVCVGDEVACVGRKSGERSNGAEKE